MNDLDWLIGHRLQSLIRRDYDWVASFDKDASIVIGCLWRLLESGRIRFTSTDDGYQFGLPAPVDAAAEVNRRIGGVVVEAVVLQDGLLDLTLRFSTGHCLQIIPDSSGYESWTAHGGNQQSIATGGGKLAIVGAIPDRGDA